MKCEQCGKEIESLELNIFNFDGTDRYYDLPVAECEQNAVYVDANHNWTGYELTEGERIDTVRCPYCKKFPFKHLEIQVYDIVRVVLFKTEN